MKCELTLTAYQVFISGATSSNATLSHLLWTTLALLYSVNVQVTPKLEPHVVDECMSLSTGLEFLSNHFNQAYLAVNASLLTQPFSNKYKKNFIYKTSEIGFCTESILQAKHEMHNNALLTLKYSMRYKWQTNMKASSITGFEHYKKGVRTSCTFE